MNVTKYECTTGNVQVPQHSMFLRYVTERINAQNDNVTGSIHYQTSMLQNVYCYKMSMLQISLVT